MVAEQTYSPGALFGKSKTIIRTTNRCLSFTRNHKFRDRSRAQREERKVVLTPIDIYGGLTIYRQNKPIMRWFYCFTDNSKTLFDIVPLNANWKCQNEHVFLEFSNVISSLGLGMLEDIYAIDHLTGTRIPNENYYISGGWPNLDYSQMVTNFHCSHEHRPVLERIYRFFFNRHYTNMETKTLSDAVRDYCKKSEMVVVDLRRGSDIFFEKDKHDNTRRISKFGIDWMHEKCPLRPEHFAEVKSLSIALPHECDSKYYRDLRSAIIPEKVIDLTIFEPKGIDGFLEYTSIKNLYLIHADKNIDLRELGKFRCLEKLFISSDSDITEYPQLRKWKGEFNIEIVLTGGEHSCFEYWPARCTLR